MTDPRQARNDLERMRGALLRSAKSDAPSPQALKRTLSAVGLGGAILANASGVAAGSAARAILLKWFGVGIVVGISTLGVGRLVGSTGPQRQEFSPQPQAIVSAAPAPVEATVSSVAVVQDPRPSHSGGRVPSARVTAAPSEEVAPALVPTASASTGPTALTVEIGLIDDARRALAANDTSGALQALERHSKECRPAQLGHEAAILRMEALARRGDCSGAEGLARQFVTSSPKGPLAVKAKALVLQHCGKAIE